MLRCNSAPQSPAGLSRVQDGRRRLPPIGTLPLSGSPTTPAAAVQRSIELSTTDSRRSRDASTGARVKAPRPPTATVARERSTPNERREQRCRTISLCSVETSSSSEQTPLCTPTEDLSTRSTAASASRDRRELSPTSSLRSASPVRGQGLSWTRGKAVGSGSFGTVFKAFNPSTLQIFAVKEALLDESHDSKYRERLNLELEICRTLRHPHIVSYLGHDYTDQHLYIYLEYVAGGSVASILSEFGPLTGPPLRKATLGMLEGLDYLHTRSPPVVHRDIKGANVLVDLEFCVKLADFGCSKCSNDTKSFTTLGSVPWMAPEVISQEGGHGRKADIWSFGCTVIEMASAEKPWGNGAFNNMMFALHHIATSPEIPPIPDTVSTSCDDLIRSCLRRSQHERPNTGELLMHEFFGPIVSKPRGPNAIRRFKTL